MESSMKKIAFGLYDQLGHKSPDYRDHVRAISMFDIKVSNDRIDKNDKKLFESDSIDTLLNQAYDLGYNYIYVMSIGYITSDHSLLYEIHDFAERNQFWLLAHLLEDKNYDKNAWFKNQGAWFQIHPQSFYLNLDVWAQIGKPKFGNNEHVKDLVLPDYNRSKENIHDDYTPLWLKPAGDRPENVLSNGQTYTGPVKQGWNLIATLLANNVAIGNFPESIRRKKSYLYPEIDDDRFQRILAGETGLAVEPTGPTYAQHQYLKETDLSRVPNAVFVFNNDSMSLERISFYPTMKLNTLYAVAAGFKPFQLLTQVDSTASRVVYIDYSQQALDFRKWLVENWNGEDYIKAIADYNQLVPEFDPIWVPGRKHEFPDRWSENIQLFGGKQQWLKFWNRYRLLEHAYLKINLLSDYESLLCDMQSHQGNNMIWISNSFYTPATVRNFPPGELKTHWETFLKSVVDNNVCVQMVGYDHTGGYQTQLHGKIQYE